MSAERPVDEDAPQAFLVFQLEAPLAAWGSPAVGEFRGSDTRSGESALLGLLGAALGLRRDDAPGLAALQSSCRFAVGTCDEGVLLRDFHTVQSPPRTALKGMPHRTRKEELEAGGDDLGTLISRRDYRQGGAWRVAVSQQPGAAHDLQGLADALRRPRFVLYLGRKSCPLAAPVHPLVVEALTVLDAFERYAAAVEVRRQEHPQVRRNRPDRPWLEALRPVRSLAWGDGSAAGAEPDLTLVRKDRVIGRKGWRFGDRNEHFLQLPEPASAEADADADAERHGLPVSAPSAPTPPQP